MTDRTKPMKPDNGYMSPEHFKETLGRWMERVVSDAKALQRLLDEQQKGE